MKKSLLFPILLGIFALSACGGSKDPTPTLTPSVNPTPTQSEPTPSKDPTSQPTTPFVTPTPSSQTPTVQPSTPTIEPTPSVSPIETPSETIDPSLPEATNQTYYFCLDYSHSDMPLYTMEWYRGYPLGKMPDAIKDIDDKDAFDPLFPIFLGWSAYPSSIDDSNLWDWKNDSSTNKDVYIFGIWVSDDVVEPTPTDLVSGTYTFKVDCDFMMSWNPVPTDFAIHVWGERGEYATWGSANELMSECENHVYSISIEYTGKLEGAIFYYKQGKETKQTINLEYDFEVDKTYVIALSDGDWVQNEYGVWCQPAVISEE